MYPLISPFVQVLLKTDEGITYRRHSAELSSSIVYRVVLQFQQIPKLLLIEFSNAFFYVLAKHEIQKRL